MAKLNFQSANRVMVVTLALINPALTSSLSTFAASECGAGRPCGNIGLAAHGDAQDLTRFLQRIPKLSTSTTFGCVAQAPGRRIHNLSALRRGNSLPDSAPRSGAPVAGVL